MTVIPRPTLSEAIAQLNESKADSATVERVLFEYGYEKMTATKLQEIKESIGL